MSGTEPHKYQEWILETIDSLRSRKARPDLERICRMVRRRYGSDPDQTRVELEKLIQSQTVLKVSYKGSISYRNAAKVLRKSRKNSEYAASIDKRAKQEHLIIRGDSAQSVTAEQGASIRPSEHGISVEAVCDSAASCSAADLEDQRTSTSTSPSPQPQQPQPQQPQPQQEGGGTQPSRVGHTARTHSVSATPSGEEASPAVNCPNNTTCSLSFQRQPEAAAPKLRTNCSQSHRLVSVRSLSVGDADHLKAIGLKDILGYPEQLSPEEKLSPGKVKVVEARDVARGRVCWTRCGNITLPLDAALERSLGGKKNDTSQTTTEEKRWQHSMEEQMEEDISQSCGDSRSPVAMTTESEAEDAEVQTTSQQHLTKGMPGPDPWTSCPLSPTDSGLDEPGLFSVESLSPIDWSVSDVVSYFTTAGFPEQSAAFRTQEIDGKSLLLMQRNDVLTGLSIKLGPALKIYEHHIKALQKIHFKEDEL
ncbi:sterile alpha motif domain-containing protein 1 [Eucyclogobius newberryi]|uniref:sterile alpha motif domain-containing protein 1 n=1 Tax=Eucyclogobius newberryi TaxID=166745 RepID=UPI003B5A2E0D